uniref:Ribonuclease Z n=1 Tax=Halydictyon mirabile TaxID=189652 RepID=A0A4D6WW71_9FLOR|nr:ribonuclease Z [Halydictyon mirabile]
MLDKAKNNYLMPGPQYGKLKKGHIFILPDGLVLDGNDFTIFNLYGSQISFLFNTYYKRQSFEISSNSDVIF